MSVVNKQLEEWGPNEQNQQLFIYLLSGVRLIGYLVEYDDEAILLSTKQLVMRSAISTIQITSRI